MRFGHSLLMALRDGLSVVKPCGAVFLGFFGTVPSAKRVWDVCRSGFDYLQSG